MLRTILPWVVGPALLLKLSVGVRVGPAAAAAIAVRRRADPLRLRVGERGRRAGRPELWLTPPDMVSPLAVATAVILLGLPLVRGHGVTGTRLESAPLNALKEGEHCGFFPIYFGGGACSGPAR